MALLSARQASASMSAVAQERGLLLGRIKQPVGTPATGQNSVSIAMFAETADVKN